jgi:predicted enzyme related to lactoylglutathione lyase
MKASHIHLGVRDLQQAISWFEKFFEIKPNYQNPRMASLPFGGVSLILDSSESDAEVTIAFDSQDCDADFRKLTGRGAAVIEKPEDKSWGVRAAYFKGPGGITFELEQVLR